MHMSVVSRLMFILGALYAQVALAQTEAAAPSQPAHASFNYVFGQTQLADAMAYWRASGARIVGSGRMALGSGSGMDGASKLSFDKVVLVDVAGIDFEGLSSARFGFYEEKLYRIQASFGLAGFKKTDLVYDKEQLKAFEAGLRQKHGKPTEERRSLLAGKNGGPDILTWKLGAGTLQFQSNLLNGGLVLFSQETETKIREQVKEYCKTVNRPGHFICW